VLLILRRRALAAAIGALLPALAAATPIAAEEAKFGALRFERAWVRAATISVSAAYLTISTVDPAGDRLLAVSSPAAGRAELHTVIMDGGVMRMRPVEAIDIRLEAPAELRPGSLHIMLLDLVRPLRPDDTVRLVLRFERAGAVEVAAPVRAGPP
jgi:hypothetical protein